jgi:hypothetical protein
MAVKLRSVVAGIVGLAALAVPATADAGPARGGDHCVQDVVGQLPSGEYELSAPVCYSSLREAMTAVGVDVRGLESVSAATLDQNDLISSTIGVHYNGFNQTGSSITVSGVNCLGGYVNLSVAWRNRVSSTLNGCPAVRHFSGLDLTGISQTTLGSGGNLSTLNNLADSIQYTT